MRVGANLPYDCDPAQIGGVVAFLERLGADELLIASHEPPALYEALARSFPRGLWHVRVKGNLSWWPADVYDVEWPGEQSPVDVCRWLLARGIRPRVVLWNEPDVELCPTDYRGDRWACDQPEERERALERYVATTDRAIDALRSEFGGEVDLALAPLSQGNPERFEWWRGRLGPLYDQADFVAEHCYSDGRPHDDPDWGGRWRSWLDLGKPIDILEANDNGAFATQDPAERAADYADYVRGLEAEGLVRSVSLFTSAGGRGDGGKPSWWFLTPEISAAVAEARHPKVPVEEVGV